MKLRIARKIDPGTWDRRARAQRHKRTWWSVYTDDQLRRAARRLRRAWRACCPLQPGGMIAVNEDFFAANRVESRLARQRALRRVTKR
jgi:hypothetical protein